MTSSENARTLRAVLRAFNSGDIESTRKGLHPDVTYTIRGHASVSGTFVGLEEITRALRRIRDMTGDSLSGEPLVLLAEGEHVMMYAHVTASRPDGRQFDSCQAALYRFRDGKLLEGDSIPVDQRAWEAFFAD